MTQSEENPVTPTGRHIYVGTSGKNERPEEVLSEEEPETVEVVDVISQNTRSSHSQGRDGAEEPEAEPAEKRSGLKSVRSFLSKTFKKT